jgi:hypothetical protein
MRTDDETTYIFLQYFLLEKIIVLQFATYTSGEPELNQFINLSRSLFARNSLIEMRSAAQELLEEAVRIRLFLVSKDIYRIRTCLIFARLYFYDLVDESTIKYIFSNFYQPADIRDSFSYEELIACLGFDFSSQLDIRRNHNNDLFDSINPLRQNDSDYVLYRPAKSGFFSVLENIVNAHILAEAIGKKLLLDESGDWWIYKIPFQNLFGGQFRSAGITSLLQSTNLKAVRLDFPVMRYFAALLAFEAPIFFKTQKRALYQPLCTSLSLNSNLKDTSHKDRPLFYFRAGDKLLLESIRPPTDFIIKDMKLGLRNYGKISILSDDWSTAKSLGDILGGGANVINLTEPQFRGYFSKSVNPQLPIDTNGLDDIRAIINNFTYMVQSAFLVGCPSSNLVNAVQWCRPESPRYLQLSSLPGMMYTVL